MASYSLHIKSSAAKELAHISGKDRARVIARIQALAEDARPAGAEKLSSQERYRIRQGDYRILYEIDDHRFRITVVKIGHRRDVYRI